jgi:hypothetical protein
MSITAILTRTAFAAALTILAASSMTLSSAQADGFSRYMDIVNRSGNTLTRLYASNASGGGWGQNRLGGRAVQAGQSVRVNFDDGSGQCNFNIRVEFANGTSTENYQVDVCSLGSYNFF